MYTNPGFSISLDGKIRRRHCLPSPVDYASVPRMNSIVTSSLWEILLPVLDDFSDACVEKVDVRRC